MQNAQIITKTRPVSNFDRVVLRSQHENRLIIVQGDQESLTIQAPGDILQRIKSEVRRGELAISLEGGWLDKLSDAFTTSLTRPQIKYTLRLRELSSLEIYALAYVTAESLKADDLSVKYFGPGVIDIDSLQANKFAIELSGASNVELGGHVEVQTVLLRGLGTYEALGLQSAVTKIELNGPGMARVWATEQLDVTINGPGVLSYHGEPEIKKRLSPMGSIKQIDGLQTVV